MADGGGAFHLTKKQNEALKLFGGEARHLMLVGGARSGKTFFIVRAIVIRALRAPQSRHVVWRFRYNACRASIWLDTFAKVMRLCFSDVKVTPHSQDGYVSFPNGAEIWFAGLDDKERVEKILGMEFATVYLGECSQITYASALIALTRLAQQCPGLQNRAYYDLNPTTTTHWTYRLFVEGIDPVSRKPIDPKKYGWMRINPMDNKDNIDRDFIESLESMPEKMRKRFLSGEYVADIDGALWTPECLERSRITLAECPAFERISVAVDPSGCSGNEDERSDEIGITVGARAGDKFFVLADASGRFSPERWGAIACGLLRTHGADRIVGEKNYGGDMVRAIVQSADINAPYKHVTATRGKIVRAEPVAALWEERDGGKQRAHLVGSFPKLEEQMLGFSTAGYMGDKSPDRADSMVWAAHDLMFAERDDGLLQFYERWGTEIASSKKQAQDEAKL